MTKQRLLHIQVLPLLSGVQNVMLNILENLPEDQYDIYVISQSGGPLIDKLAELYVTHIPMDSLKRDVSIQDFKAFIGIYRICRKYKFDIVHTHSSKPGFLGRIAARLAGVKKIIHTSHGYPFNVFQPLYKQFFYRICEALAGLFCDYMVFVNNADREMAVTSNLISKQKALTIYNGIDVPETFERQTKDEEFIIGSSFRFWEQKNPIQTIKVAIAVCKRVEQIKFIFLGDGELLEICKKHVQNAGLEDRITFPGWQKDVMPWLKQFDVFLLYSKWEGLPISILEAMSIGLPIVASDINGNNELVSEQNGFLFKLNEVDKLIETLISLPERKEELIVWGNQSQLIVENKFSMKKFVSSYKSIYDL